MHFPSVVAVEETLEVSYKSGERVWAKRDVDIPANKDGGGGPGMLSRGDLTMRSFNIHQATAAIRKAEARAIAVSMFAQCGLRTSFKSISFKAPASYFSHSYLPPYLITKTTGHLNTEKDLRVKLTSLCENVFKGRKGGVTLGLGTSMNAG